MTLSGRCEGHQKRNITPYMHAMVYHVPDMMKRFGNVKQFSGQGASTYFYIYLYIYIYIPLQMNQELRRITMMQGGITGQVIVGMLL